MSAFKKVIIFVAVIGVIVPSFVFAKYGLPEAVQGTDLIGSSNTSASQTVPELIGTIVGVVLSFVGVIFFLLILYAGLTWMTAFGNTEKVDKAKSIVEHAAIGLVIVLAAYAISKFVFGSLTGSNQSAQTAPTDQSHTAGQTCGDNSVWNSNNACVSQCEYSLAGVCQEDNLACSGAYVAGFCPGASTIKCCSQTQL